MTFSTGLDIGGTKIAAAVYDAERRELHRATAPTPPHYQELVQTCRTLVAAMDKACGARTTVGVGVPGVLQEDGTVVAAANTPCLTDQALGTDLERALARPVALANDANCAALSEAVDGAGEGFGTMFGLILGTGVGGGLVVNRRIVAGRNGLAGEIGHIPLPFREDSDGSAVTCAACGQAGCIDASASGTALARLHAHRTGQTCDAATLAERAQAGDAEAEATLDAFLTTVAKAMLPILHLLDPDAIVVSGGLTNLPRLFAEVPKRWGRYALRRDIRTAFLPARHGALSGLRGAAWAGQPTAYDE